MNDNVVSINANKPHISGTAKCLDCEDEFIAVEKEGAYSIECPSCKTERAVWYMPIVPQEGEAVYVCGCRGDMFLVQQDGILCAKCGKRHTDY